MLLEDYLPVLIFAIICMVFPPVTYVLNRWFRPGKRTLLKDTAYECGEVPIGTGHIQFTFQYYMYAILFVAFDVVVVFLVLWALVFDDSMGRVAIASVILFVLIVGAAVGISLKKEKEVLI